MFSDPSMLGTSGYSRSPLDFYPTPKTCVDAFLKTQGDELAPYLIWEPASGDGAISNYLDPYCRGVVTSDITAYPGFDPDALLDFYKVKDLQEVEDATGSLPDAIVTNPPYGRDAEQFARHGLDLLEPVQGYMAFLCRNEWDAAGRRDDLFNHPAFAAKVTMQHRPRWIPGSTTSPRHYYAWYVWDWAKPAGIRPEVFYVR